MHSYLAILNLLAIAAHAHWQSPGLNNKDQNAPPGQPQGAIQTEIIVIDFAGNTSPLTKGADATPPGMMPMTHQVSVGGDSLVFSPPSLQANKYDYVQFTFLKVNHTLTQSTLSNPCIKKVAAGGETVIDSGFMPPANGVNPSMKIQIMDAAAPLWFYCKQGKGTPTSHCDAKGMAFSINSNETAEGMFRGNVMALEASVKASVAGGSMAASSMPPPPMTMTMAQPPPPPPPPASMSMSMSTASVPPAQAQATSTGIVAGSGSANAAGQCSCSCLCGVGAFPPGAGIGMQGGMPGSMPMALAPNMAGP